MTVRFGRLAAALAVCTLFARPGAAQVTPAAGYTPPDDAPAIRVGATLFGDYTVTARPKTTDADGNEVTPNAFNVGRAYINVTGNISHLIAFRITPDITRETGTGSSLNGSYTFRLKYAYAQFNLDQWMTRGSWARFGMQQTPWVDFEETVYRYRFQGTVFADREGFLSSSDVGASFHYNLPGNYGDIHGGVYNGETYTRPEANDQKGFMVRGSFRPLRLNPRFRGLRLTGFYDADSYLKDGERRRGIVAATFEHPYLNAAFSYLATADQTRAALTRVNGRGWSAWVTPKTPDNIGWEGLVRFDHMEPDKTLDGRRNRTILGAAFWFPHQGTVTTALLFDFENVDNKDVVPVRPDERRLAVHALVNF
ncbi:MAG: hypothetical protein ABIX28_23020 [Vicinamibacterales bacterium]